jgi:hypothetical protein
LTADGRAPRIVASPGAEGAAGRNPPAWLGIGQGCLERGAVSVPESIHDEVVDVEDPRQLSAVTRHNLQASLP